MATRTLSISVPDDGFKLATWATLNNGDDGAPFMFVDHIDRCIQVTGTFGAGGTVVWEGSNNGTNWSTLYDTVGNALSLTAAAVRQVNEQPIYVRPRVTAGDGTTALVVTMLARSLAAV